MPTIYIHPTGSDSGTGSAESPFRTWYKTNQHLGPGVTVIPADGTYADAPLPPVSGTEEQPIKIVGQGGAVITRSINLASRQWVELDGLQLLSRTGGWLHMNGASENHTLKNIRLRNEYVSSASLP
jgi:hypothetical protein